MKFYVYSTEYILCFYITESDLTVSSDFKLFLNLMIYTEKTDIRTKGKNYTRSFKYSDITNGCENDKFS
jgi:hypothetical protein